MANRLGLCATELSGVLCLACLGHRITRTPATTAHGRWAMCLCSPRRAVACAASQGELHAVFLQRICLSLGEFGVAHSGFTALGPGACLAKFSDPWAIQDGHGLPDVQITEDKHVVSVALGAFRDTRCRLVLPFVILRYMGPGWPSLSSLETLSPRASREVQI